MEVFATPPPKPLRHIFYQAVLVQVLNPKTALFFFAFLPQFVHPEHGRVFAQILLLGTTFVALALVTDSAYALVAGHLGGWMRGSARVLRTQRHFAGATYIVLGVVTAMSGVARRAR